MDSVYTAVEAEMATSRDWRALCSAKAHLIVMTFLVNNYDATDIDARPFVMSMRPASNDAWQSWTGKVFSPVASSVKAALERLGFVVRVDMSDDMDELHCMWASQSLTQAGIEREIA